MTDCPQAQVKDDEPWGEVPESETCWQQEPRRDTCWPVSGFAVENTEEVGGTSLLSHVSWLTVVGVHVKGSIITSRVG